LKIANQLNEADLVFANLESPISNQGTQVGSIYSFRAALAAVQGLVFSGIDVLSLANNHMFDFQRIALEDTMNILKQNNIDYVGAGFNKQEAFGLKIKEVKDTKIGFLAYTNLGSQNWKAKINSPGMSWIDWNDLNAVARDIENAKEKVDILIVSLHAGKEYSQEITFFQETFAKIAIDSGADIIAGHHPHVVQKMEPYGNGWIVYSLGNFVFDQGFSQETMQSIILEVIIKDKKIKELIPRQVKLNDFFQPELQPKAID
jgi:poly-gamma-glutamate synthesis protein (capsule biosynthesis protein)